MPHVYIRQVVEHMVFSVALRTVFSSFSSVFAFMQCITGYMYASYLFSFLASSKIYSLPIPQIGFMSAGYRHIWIINCFKKEYLFKFSPPRVFNSELLLLISLMCSYYTVQSWGIWVWQSYVLSSDTSSPNWNKETVSLLTLTENEQWF